MLNYIRAEFYKVLRRRYVYITLFVLLALETLFTAGFVFHNSHSSPHPFAGSIVLITEMASVGAGVCLLTGDMVFAGQYKNSTLKNEVSFGLSRVRIYLGKLTVMSLVSVIFMVITVGYYLALCAVTLPHDPMVAFGNGFTGDAGALQVVGYFLAAALPLWLGGQAVACMCLFLLNSDLGASLLFVGIYFMLDTVVELAGLLISGKTGDVLLKIHDYMPMPMMNAAKSVVGNWPFLGKAWLVGAVWFAAFTAIGLYGFNRKEIK